MKNYINELIDIGMGAVIDMTTDRVIMQDEVYQKNQSDSQTILEQLTDTFDEPQKQLFEDYIDCTMSATERACNLSYLVGVRNTIQFLSEINALKDDTGRR